jgi:hypothetical protein
MSLQTAPRQVDFRQNVLESADFAIFCLLMQRRLSVNHLIKETALVSDRREA